MGFRYPSPMPLPSTSPPLHNQETIAFVTV
jgi:hypothetical protein